MKHQVSFAMLAMSLLAWRAPSQAQYRPNGHGVDEVTRREITLNLQNATTDDFIVALARAADLNFIADATELPQTGPTISGEFSAATGHLIRDLQPGKRTLTYWRVDERTFLFWAHPDIVALTRRIVAGEDIGRVPLTVSQADAQKLLNEYLLREHNFTGRTHDQRVTIKLADAPAPVRDMVVALTQREILLPLKDEHNKVGLSDEFWKGAAIVLGRAEARDSIAVRAKGPMPGARNGITWVRGMADWKGPQERIMPPLTGPRRVIIPGEPPAKPTIAIQPLTRPEIPNELSPAALQKEAPLTRKISFEVKQRALGDLLADLQKQSGASLTAATDAPTTTARVTARVKEMSLANILTTLSRLYGVRWNRLEENNYRMHPSASSAIEAELRKVGDFSHFARGRNSPWAFWNRTKRLGELVQQMIEEVGETALRDPEGIPLSDLSTELQQEMRRELERDIAYMTIHERFSYSRDTIEQGKLSAHSANSISGIDGKAVGPPVTQVFFNPNSSGLGPILLWQTAPEWPKQEPPFPPLPLPNAKETTKAR